jgi:hypothetical protein
MTDIGIYNLSVKENKKTGQARSCWGSSLRWPSLTNHTNRWTIYPFI